MQQWRIFVRLLLYNDSAGPSFLVPIIYLFFNVRIDSFALTHNDNEFGNLCTVLFLCTQRHTQQNCANFHTWKLHTCAKTFHESCLYYTALFFDSRDILGL